MEPFSVTLRRLVAITSQCKLGRRECSTVSGWVHGRIYGQKEHYFAYLLAINYFFRPSSGDRDRLSKQPSTSFAAKGFGICIGIGIGIGMSTCIHLPIIPVPVRIPGSICFRNKSATIWTPVCFKRADEKNNSAEKNVESVSAISSLPTFILTSKHNGGFKLLAATRPLCEWTRSHWCDYFVWEAHFAPSRRVSGCHGRAKCNSGSCHVHSQCIVGHSHWHSRWARGRQGQYARQVV